MRKIYTSYFAKIRSFPKDFEPIAICGGIPSWYNGSWTKILAPKIGFFNEWKYNNHDNQYYTDHFYSEVLSELDPDEIVSKLFEISGKEKILCLICYEKPEDFCHRHLVAEWLNKNATDIIVEEFKDGKVS